MAQSIYTYEMYIHEQMASPPLIVLAVQSVKNGPSFPRLLLGSLYCYVS